MSNVKANKSPKRLAKPKKQIAAKVLREQEGYTYAEIAEWLGISIETARRYSVVDTPEKLSAFENEFSHYIKLMKYDGLGKVHKRINELIPNERRVSEVVKAGEFLEGKNTGTGIKVESDKDGSLTVQIVKYGE